MYLSVSLKNGVDAQSFINKVLATIKAYRHLSNPEFKTWKVITITDKQKGTNSTMKYYPKRILNLRT